MKKISFVILSLMSACLCLRSQNLVADFKHGLQLTNESSLRWKNELVYDPNQNVVGMARTRNLDLLQIVPSWMWQTKHGNFNEVALAQLTFKLKETVVGDGRGTFYRGSERRYGMAVRLAHYHRFLKTHSSKLQVLLGLEAKPYAELLSNRPAFSTNFPSSLSQVGVQGSLRPQLLWLPSSHFFMQFGLSSTIFDLQYNRLDSGNPALSTAEQSTSTIGWNMFPGEYTLHCGVGIRL